MKKIWGVFAGVMLAAGLVSSAQAGTRIGVLRCYMADGVGYIVASAHDARCVFTSDVTGRRERYYGRVKRLGVDLGYTHRSVIVWEVFAPTELYHHALRGDYVGASADVAVGIGGGANVLVGGNDHTISLQPVSIKAEKGLAVGAGAGKLELR